MGSPRKYDAELWQKCRQSPYSHVATRKRTNLGDHERLDFARVRDVGTHTEINHWTTAIHCRGGPIWDLRLYELFLIFVILNPRVKT